MWKSSMKRILSLLLAISLCLAFSITAYARYINELVVKSELTTSNGKAVMYSSVEAAADVTQIKITHTLQKKNGTSYTDVSGTTVTRTYSKCGASMEDTVSYTGSGTYRVKMTCKVTSPRGTDNHTEYSNTVTR